mmetsp:Transcript_115268/g.325731  ORF Transcript_115268/g.325731 Transcript_115268/m.325731 type:complete len:138 (+) Transcript_115268:3-416(+)
MIMNIVPLLAMLILLRLSTAFIKNNKTSAIASKLFMSSDRIKSTINNAINNNNVMVFSKSTCPFCMMTKASLKKLNIDHNVLELDKSPEGSDIQAELLAMTGQRTVPNVFVKGKHLGGNDDTQAAIKSGKLQSMLEL